MPEDNDPVEKLARQRVAESLGALSLDEARKVAAAQIANDEAEAKTKKKPKAE
jgi:hypothetical protein